MTHWLKTTAQTLFSKNQHSSKLTRSSSIRHLTAINNLTVDIINSILEKSHFYSQIIKNKEPIPKVLSDKVVANLFFEDSTRTKFSFEVAAKRLGASVLNFSPETSSVNKGESLYDTLKTFENLGVDIGVIRHSDDHFVESLKTKLNFCIVNAGAGKFEHPSQSLLDLFTIKEEFKKLTDLTVTICGDINSSRVAKSNISLFKKMGIKVLLCGPESLLPPPQKLEDNCQVSTLKEAAKVSDVLMFLRVQHERHQAFELSIENYNNEFGLNHNIINLMPTNSIVMHPAPVNRGVEILDELVEHPKSRIFKQMENGVYTRMAILDWLYCNEE